jgi:hypothetical protein
VHSATRPVISSPTFGAPGRDVVDLCTARPSPVRWTDSHAPTKRHEAASKAAPRPSKPGNRARGGRRHPQLASPTYPKFASSARLVSALLPRMLEEEAGHQPTRKAGPQLGSPSSPAWMMNILEVEDRGEAVARLASLHHKAGGHPSR